LPQSPTKTIRSQAKHSSTAPIRACAIWLTLVFTNLLQGEVELSWQDNSSNEDGFEIERSTNGSPFEKIATVQAGATRFTDSDTVAGDLYFYRVRAYNAYGKSGYTNVAKFEIPAPISFEEWFARILIEGTFVSSFAAPAASLIDEDLPNLLCYAHGINPFQPDRSLLAKARTVIVDGQSTRVIERALFKYSLGVETKLLVSEDLEEWEQVDYESSVTHETLFHHWERITLPNQSQAKFYKLELSLSSDEGV